MGRNGLCTRKGSEERALNPRRKWPAKGSYKLHHSSTRVGWRGGEGVAGPFPVHFSSSFSNLKSSSQVVLSEYVHDD